MDLISLDFFVSIITGVIIGGLINVTGVGGGVMIIPSLVLLTGMPVAIAVGTASWFSTITKIASSIYHIRSKSVNWVTTGLFLAGAVPSTVVVSVLVVSVVNDYVDLAGTIQKILTYSIVVIMLLSAFLVYKNVASSVNRGEKGASKVGLLVSGVFIGGIMALTGVGGGALIIPALVFFTGESMKKIVSCSIAIAVVISLVTGSVYAQGGLINGNILLGLLLGSAVGVPLSDVVRKRISNERLTQVVLVLIVVSACLLFLQTL